MDENFLRSCYVIRNCEQQQENQHHRYRRFDDHRSFTDQNQPTSLTPIDKYHLVYFALFCCGIGFLLPYSIYITCVDYFHRQFPQTAIIFHLNFIYIILAFSTVLFSNIIANILSVKRRVIIGYSLTLIILMFITIFCVGLELFPQRWSYSIFLLSVAILAVGCTCKIYFVFSNNIYQFLLVQQSSFYGLTSMLPFRYTQAVMTGESKYFIFYMVLFLLMNFYF
jgi:solute carrier family 29 (equilibrative nucleoside transporter) protein 4